MSIALATLVEELRKRVEALEAGQAATRAPLRESNARRKANAARLREMIRGTGESDPKRILQSLARSGLNPLPTLRTVQAHIAVIRKAGGTA